MCDEKKCQHDPKDLCSCGPVKGGDSYRLMMHLAQNITDVEWELNYLSLTSLLPYRLCLIGKCKVCGGRLCMEHKPFLVETLDDFLAAAYRYLYQFHHNMGQCLNSTQLRGKFVEMFHEMDRPFVQEWLTRPENQTVSQMYRRSGKKAYTIVRTCADADKGNFPPPMGEGTFLDEDIARGELKRLVSAEKESMDIPFSDEEYREEYGDDFWEAYRDGYAAGWFVHYEILESPLYLGPDEEKGE